MNTRHGWVTAGAIGAALILVLLTQRGAAANSGAGDQKNAPAVTWIRLSGTGEAYVRLDALDVVRVSQTSSSRAEALTVSRGKLKHVGIIKDAEFDQLRPRLAEWFKVGNDGLLVNPDRVTTIAFDQTVSFAGKRATVYVTDLVAAGIAQDGQEIAKLEAWVKK